MASKIENLDNRPWVPHHIPNAIRKELYRRTLDQGINYINTNADWSNYKKYKGPLTAWIRVVSNGTGITKTNVGTAGISQEEFKNKSREGFVMYGGQGFDDSFGTLNFKNSGNLYTQNILGYDTNGVPHKLDTISNSPNLINLKDPTRNIPVMLPPPGVVSIEASIQKERIRKITINWKCYSFAQLEYMTPYFLTPGISLIVEYGWNLFNFNSLIDLTDKNKLTELWKDGTPLYQKILDSNGMYDVTFGSVANFEFGTQDGMIYDCKTEIYSKHRNHTGALINEAPTNATIKNGEQDIVVTKPSFYEFCNQRLQNVAKCLEGPGKNFFDLLTADEKNKVENDKTNVGYEIDTLKKKFFGGKKENRIFLARNKIDGDPLSSIKGTKSQAIYQQPDEIDWDSASPNDVWVTMGFVVELLNLFIGIPVNIKDKNNNNPSGSADTNFSLYTIDIDNVAIGAHPNLISVDGSKVLIPNPIAPKYNLGAVLWKCDYPKENYETNTLQFQTSYKTSTFIGRENMALYDLKLWKIFKTGYVFASNKILENIGPKYQKNIIGVYRNNLDRIINRFRYNFGDGNLLLSDAAFPQTKDYTEKGNNYPKYYWGYLKDLFVHVNVVIECARNAKTAEDFLSSLLNIISAASAGLWELAVVEDEKKLRIIDKKIISKQMYESLYQFDISSDSCIKSLSFNVTPSNAQMTQVIAGSTNNQGQGQSTPNQLPDFRFGDRLGVNSLIPETKKTLVNESGDLLRQLQKYGKVDGAYAMTLKEKDPKKYYEVFHLALPSKSLLLSIMDCNDREENLNMYGGQQPNFTCELTLQGIAGLRTFQCFSIKNLPKPYSPEDVIFQIVDITHSIQNGEWVTTIKAGIRPIQKIGNKKYEFSNGKEAFDSNEKPLLENVS